MALVSVELETLVSEPDALTKTKNIERSDGKPSVLYCEVITMFPHKREQIFKGNGTLILTFNRIPKLKKKATSYKHQSFTNWLIIVNESCTFGPMVNMSLFP